jgi:hypothetical protein
MLAAVSGTGSLWALRVKALGAGMTFLFQGKGLDVRDVPFFPGALRTVLLLLRVAFSGDSASEVTSENLDGPHPDDMTKSF